MFDTVSITTKKPSCTGYEFKGWEVITKDVTRVGEDYFIMPEKDVVIRAKWSKLDLAKSMDGEVSKVMTLYKVMSGQAVMDNVSSEFVSNASGIQFKSPSSDTNGKGIYLRAGTENNEFPIYYYRGDVDNNHVKFANFCWKIVRTTETGGVKLIYDGVPDSNGYCNNTGTSSQIGTSVFNTNSSSPADVGYMYGDRYTYSNKGMGESKWYELVNKTRIFKTGMNSTNYYYSDSVTYENGSYILNNPKQYTWSNDYEILKGYYTCFSNTATSCTSVGYVNSTDRLNMYYVVMNNGETYDSLVDEANQIIWIYGNDITWNGSEYTLVDTVKSSPMEWNNDGINKVKNGHRYTCFSNGNTCSTIYYIMYTDSPNSVYYITLKDGKNITTALNEMFSEDNNLRNQTDSTIKKKIDSWYQANMVDYTNDLEDTVWCNDRSIYQLNDWDKDYIGTEHLYFGPYERRYSSYQPVTICPNQNDAFTVNSENGNGKLTYPVALLTMDEIMMAGGVGSNNSSYYLYTGQHYWSLSPSYYGYSSYFISYFAFGFDVFNNGSLSVNGMDVLLGVRPSVSLTSEMIVVDGDGSSESPYIVMSEDEKYK